MIKSYYETAIVTDAAYKRYNVVVLLHAAVCRSSVPWGTVFVVFLQAYVAGLRYTVTC